MIALVVWYMSKCLKRARCHQERRVEDHNEPT